MTTRKPDQGGPSQPTPPAAENPAPTPSQADAAHIATAGYWREQQATIDRIAKLKAARLARGDQPQPAKPKPKPKPKTQSPSASDRPWTTRSRRWGT